jgi:hypothetical protein
MLFEAGAPQRRSDVNRIIGTHSLLLSSPAPAPSGTPVVDAQLTLEAVTKNACGLRLNGRDTHDIGTLGLGSMNGYALSLLRQLDLAMHLRDAHYGAATPHTPSL